MTVTGIMKLLQHDGLLVMGDSVLNITPRPYLLLGARDLVRQSEP